MFSRGIERTTHNRDPHQNSRHEYISGRTHRFCLPFIIAAVMISYLQLTCIIAMRLVLKWPRHVSWASKTAATEPILDRAHGLRVLGLEERSPLLFKDAGKRVTGMQIHQYGTDQYERDSS